MLDVRGHAPHVRVDPLQPVSANSAIVSAMSAIVLNVRGHASHVRVDSLQPIRLSLERFGASKIERKFIIGNLLVRTYSSIEMILVERP